MSDTPRTSHQVLFQPEHLPLLKSAGLADYSAVMACREGSALVKPGLGRRERIRLDLTAIDGSVRTVYLKRYADIAPARREWQGLQLVRAAGVPTMEPVGMGTGPAGGFVMVGTVPGEAIERCLPDLLARRGKDSAAMTSLAESLGHLAGTLHGAGLAHRDFYACHVFLHEVGQGFDLYLIDLARVFRPRWRKWRWRAKDLSQLYFSLPAQWKRDYWPTLRRAYASTLCEDVPPGVDRTILSRAARLQRRADRQEARLRVSSFDRKES